MSFCGQPKIDVFLSFSPKGPPLGEGGKVGKNRPLTFKLVSNRIQNCAKLHVEGAELCRINTVKNN